MRELLRGGLLLTLSNLSVRAGSYLFRVLMGRTLAPYEFGLLNLALPLQYLVIVLSSASIAPSLAKFVAEKGEGKKEVSEVISPSLFYFTLLGILVGGGFFLLSGGISRALFHDPALALPLRVSALALPFAFPIAVYTGAFQGRKRIGSMAAALLLQQALRILLALALVAASATALSAIGGSSLGIAFTLPLVYLLSRRLRISGLRPSIPPLEPFRKVFLYSLPISATALSAFLLAYIDILLLGFYKGTEVVGVYSAASPTSRLLLAFATALSAVLLPTVSELNVLGAKGREEIRERHRYCFRVSLAVFAPTTLFSLFFSEEIISLLFGPVYRGAAAPFAVLVVGTAFLGIFTLNSGVFQGIGRPGVPMKLLLLTALLDFLLNLFLIPPYGLMGAAYASSGSFLFAGIASTVLLQRDLR
jgi:stage V sporulation protein B